MSHELSLLILFAASLFAGAQNALAGGGSFVTFPALLLTGLDPRAANITSTIALFPGQTASGWSARQYVSGTPGVPFRTLLGISLLGGGIGALLLLATPATFFARLVPWLVLFATAVFAWGSFLSGPQPTNRRVGARLAEFGQFLIAIYGGYFGGGIGFLMLAALAMQGLAVRRAAATKNALAAAMNASAVLVFLASPDVHWPQAVVAGSGAMAGGFGGAWLLMRVPEKLLRGGVVAIGAVLTFALFLRPM